MSSSALLTSEYLLMTMGTRLFVYHDNRIPQDCAVIVVSNHRSFLDAPILMQALKRPIRIACHHYMGEVPVLKELIKLLGCFPLDKPGQRQHNFLQEANRFLQSGQWVGLFPEGGKPMVRLTQPGKMADFQRGFAHLALRSSVTNLAVLPVAIASVEETVHFPFPLRLLRLFDPSEPLFNQPGWHPVAVYHRAHVFIGRPYWIGEKHKRQYQGRGCRKIVTELTDYCDQEIGGLLGQGIQKYQR